MRQHLPEWLPETARTSGDPHAVFAALYDIFQRDLIAGIPELWGLPIYCDVRPGDRGYEEGFWHLVARKDQRTRERLFDPPRAERLPWLAPVLANCDQPEVLTWDYLERGRAVRSYLWFQPGDYCIILEKVPWRDPVRLKLITAFHLDGQRRRDDLMKKYHKRILQND